MKKIVVVVVFVLVAAAGVFGFLYFQQSHQVFTLESVLPAKPAFYVRADHLSQRVDNFAKTKLFQELKGIDYKKAATAFGVSSDAFKQTEEAWGTAFSDDNQRMFKALFGNAAAIAVYTDGGSKDIFSNVFIVTQLSPEIAAAETVSKFFGQFNKDLKMDTEKYNGKDINLIESNDGKFTVGYVRFKDIVVIGVGEKAAKSAVDVAAKKQKALSTDENYLKRVKRSYDGSQTFGYFDIKTFYPFLGEELGQLAQTQKDAGLYKSQLEEQLKQIKGLEALVFSSKPGDVVTLKADLLYNKTELSPEMSMYYSCSPQENKSAKFVPWDAVAYQWNSCLDFTQIWSQYKKQVAEQGKAMGQDLDVNKMLGVYEKMLGVSIDQDLLPALGKEFGLYVTDVDLSGSIPLPKVVLFVETSGRDRSEALIAKLMKLQPNLQFDEQKYGDETIRYIPIPLAEGLALSYTYVGNTLLLATGVDILKSSFDAVKDPSKSIGINAAMRANEGPKNSVFLIQVDRALQKTVAVIDWSIQAAKQNQVQREAFLAGSQKNLDDIRNRKERLTAEVTQKQSRITQLTAAPVDPATDPAAQMDALKREVEQAQKELAATEEKEKNLSQQIAAYENKAPKQPDNQQALDEFIKPLLKALENIKYFSATTVNNDGVLGSTVQVKIE